MVWLALNQVCRVSVSTYNGVISDDWIREMAEDDLKSLVDKKNKIKLKKDWKTKKVDIKDISIDVDYESWDTIRKEFAECFRWNIEKVVEQYHNTTLAEVLKRYGLLYHGMNFWMPKYYNYEDDELWIVLTEDQLEDDDLPPRQVINPELIPYVEDYIENVRVASYDGYHSFEPTNVDSVGRLDYAYLWAILQKEWLYNDIQQQIVDCCDICGEILRDYTTVYYEYRWEKWIEHHTDRYNWDEDGLRFVNDLVYNSY